MADAIKAALGHETELVSGGRGEFTVWVGGTVVAEKRGDNFPTPEDVVATLRTHLN